VSTTPNASKFFALQTIALEFHVHGALDGSTPSPAFVLPPDDAAVTDPDSGCVIIDIPGNLGLIDLSGGGLGGTRADKIVRALFIAGPTPIPLGDTGLVARAFDGITDPQGQLVIPAGAVGIDTSNCIFVPGSAQLQLDGMSGVVGDPILVRICIWQPKTVEEHGEMVQVCCCRAGVFDEEGNPFFTTALFPTESCTRTVNTVAPDAVAAGVGDVPVNIGGSGFAEGDIVYFISQDGGASLVVSSNTFVSVNLIQVIVNVPASALGDYTVIVAPPLSPVQCQGVLEDAFNVAP